MGIVLMNKKGTIHDIFTEPITIKNTVVISFILTFE